MADLVRLCQYAASMYLGHYGIIAIRTKVTRCLHVCTLHKIKTGRDGIGGMNMMKVDNSQYFFIILIY